MAHEGYETEGCDLEGAECCGCGWALRTVRRDRESRAGCMAEVSLGIIGWRIRREKMYLCSKGRAGDGATLYIYQWIMARQAPDRKIFTPC